MTEFFYQNPLCEIGQGISFSIHIRLECQCQIASICRKIRKSSNEKKIRKNSHDRHVDKLYGTIFHIASLL